MSQLPFSTSGSRLGKHFADHGVCLLLEHRENRTGTEAGRKENDSTMKRDKRQGKNPWHQNLMHKREKFQKPECKNHIRVPRETRRKQPPEFISKTGRLRWGGGRLLYCSWLALMWCLWWLETWREPPERETAVQRRRQISELDVEKPSQAHWSV